MTMTLHRQSDARFPGKRHPLGQLMLALYGLGISGAGLLAPAVAQAQAETAAAPAMDIQEVVVTARKRSGLGGSRMGKPSLQRFYRQQAFLVNDGTPSPWWFGRPADPSR